MKRLMAGLGFALAACGRGSDERVDSAVSAPPAIQPAPETATSRPGPQSQAPSGATTQPQSAVTRSTADPTSRASADAPPPKRATDLPGLMPNQSADDQGPVVAPSLSAVDTTITIRANGPELMFDPATITLKQGTRVKIRFQNMGTFAHNFILVRDDSDLDEIIQRAHDATENVPLSLRSKMIAFSNLANPTRTVETSFVVPAPGDYTYVCLVEGHANTMVGRLRSIP